MQFAAEYDVAQVSCEKVFFTIFWGLQAVRFRGGVDLGWAMCIRVDGNGGEKFEIVVRRRPL